MSRSLQMTDSGLYCPAGDFWVDPSKPVPRAVITHAHSDHARPGCGQYLAAESNRHLLPMRVGEQASIQWLRYGESVSLGNCRVSLHPSGHMLGAAQVRLEVGGFVTVVTGDYKLEPDSTCAPWEPVSCHLLVTETTFGLPVYRWPDPQDVRTGINDWWRTNAEQGRASCLFGYAIGKSQRLLSGLDPSIGPIYTHGAVERGTQAYRATGVALPSTIPVATTDRTHQFERGLILAVPSSHGTPWMNRFGDASTAMASGWMMIRGQRRRRGMDRGFILSDHVDWSSLMRAIQASNAEEVWATHGYSHTVVRFLREQGMKAHVLEGRGQPWTGDDGLAQELQMGPESSPPSIATDDGTEKRSGEAP